MKREHVLSEEEGFDGSQKETGNDLSTNLKTFSNDEKINANSTSLNMTGLLSHEKEFNGSKNGKLYAIRTSLKSRNVVSSDEKEDKPKDNSTNLTTTDALLSGKRAKPNDSSTILKTKDALLSDEKEEKPNATSKGLKRRGALLYDKKEGKPSVRTGLKRTRDSLLSHEKEDNLNASSTSLKKTKKEVVSSDEEEFDDYTSCSDHSESELVPLKAPCDGQQILADLIKTSRLIQQTTATSTTTSRDIHSCLRGCQLHDYQLQGVRWLKRLWELQLNGILGDEMGLGKTLQTIAFIGSLLHTNPHAPILIISPLSVVNNWRAQFQQYAPQVRLMVYTGDKATRVAMQQEVKQHVKSLPKEQHRNPSSFPFSVMLTSYELVLTDVDFLKKFQWHFTVVDEAHRLKNKRAKLYSVLLEEMYCPRKLLLTGTPVQNNLRELFNLFAFCNPSLFVESFEDKFVEIFQSKETMVKNNVEIVLSSFMLLRRLQDVSDCLKLPPISQVIVHAGMSQMQKAYYKKILQKENIILDSSSSSSMSMSMQNTIAQLRKVCNHPYMFPGAEPEPFEEGDHIWKNSGKLFLLHNLLPSLYEKKHKILLFSQSTAMLDIVQDYLNLVQYLYERIDGSIRGADRWQAIKNFTGKENADCDSEPFIFLLSTRAGGVGLNLQAADTVIFIDSDYNPQMDLQALARAYRIGQQKPIHVIRFITAHSVEEIIQQRSIEKLKMTQNIRSSCADSGNQQILESDSKDDDPMDVIQYGLCQLMEEKDELTDLKPSYINAILRRETQTMIKKDAECSNSNDCSIIPLQEDNHLQLKNTNGVYDENMYVFDGKDYTTLHRSNKLKNDDKNAYLNMILPRPSGDVDPAYSKKRLTRRKSTEVTSYNGNGYDSAELLIAQNEFDKKRIENKKKRQDESQMRKKKLWQKNDYTSMVLKYPSSEILNDFITKNLQQSTVNYLYGDASQPSKFRKYTSIIAHCVNTGGSWCNRGFFNAISRLSDTPSIQYEKAKENKDLKLGQAHMIPIDGEGKLFVCLLVVQTNQAVSMQSPFRRMGGKFSLPALEMALTSLSNQIVTHQDTAVVHMPRIGEGISQFNWYSTERIIRKCLSQHGIKVCVYYYSGKKRKAICTNTTRSNNEKGFTRIGEYFISKANTDQSLCRSLASIFPQWKENIEFVCGESLNALIEAQDEMTKFANNSGKNNEMAIIFFLDLFASLIDLHQKGPTVDNADNC